MKEGFLGLLIGLSIFVIFVCVPLRIAKNIIFKDNEKTYKQLDSE